MKDADRVFFLMGKELSHAITPAEEQELQDLLVAAPELWYAYELIQAVNSLDDVTKEYVQEIQSLLDSRIEPEKLHSLLLEKLEDIPPVIESVPSSKHKAFPRFAAVAAGIAVIALAGWALFRTTVKDTPVDATMSEIVAPRGSKTHVVLADGTTVWLNAGSRLTYPRNFGPGNREVYLTGEGYFKVVHQEQHAFIVHTPEVDIKDLGTTFNVKAYAGSPITETTLIEGAIEVSLKKDPARKIQVSPGEKLVLHNKQVAARKEQEPVYEVARIIPYSKTNDIVETAWIEDKLIFRNERFEDLAVMMERRYNISIVIRNEEIKAYQLTGIFKHENITEALKLLQVIVPFKFKINNEQVIIYK